MTVSAATSASSSAVITSTAPKASSSSALASAVTTSSIDVASIVSQLMSVENQPLTALNSKITNQKTVISDLGRIKSDVAALTDSLSVFESSSTYSNLTITSTDSSVATATTGVGAVAGTHQVIVSQAAQSTSYNITGFLTNSDLINLDPTGGFQITIGTTSYSTNGGKTVLGVTTANAIATITKSATDINGNKVSTVADLKTWINQLDLNISANLVQQNSSNWALQVIGTNQGSSNDFYLSGLITGSRFSGFASNTAAITLDPVTGFVLSFVGGSSYNTPGTSPPITTISGLASWINGLGVNASAAVVVTGNTYSLNITPKNGSAFTTSGLPSTYAAEFSANNEVVSLDAINGFQVTVGSTIYKSAGNGAIAITPTGAGNTVTVGDLANWINNLSGANLSASIVGSGSRYSLEVNNTDSLSSKTVAISGINSAGTGGANTTTLNGFSSVDGPIGLDLTNGFAITVQGTTYKTSQAGLSIGGIAIPSLATSGPSAGSVHTSTLTDINNWITNLSSAFSLGLTTTISNSGAPYSLTINCASSTGASGIVPNAQLTGFASASDTVAIDPSSGFSVSIGANVYSSNGKKNGANDSAIPVLDLNGLNNELTLSDLQTWINSLSTNENLNIHADILSTANIYSLEVHSTLSSSTSAISLTGSKSLDQISGFVSPSQLLALDATSGFSLTVTNGGSSTSYSTKTTPLTTYLTDSNNNHIARLSDLANWINSLTGSGLTASVVNTGSGNNLQIFSAAGTSVSSSGIISSSVQSGFTTSSLSDPIVLASSGFQITVGNGPSTSYTFDAGASQTATTLGDLVNWINGQTVNGQTGPTGFNAAIVGSGLSWQILISQQSGSDAISSSGIIAGGIISSNQAILTATNGGASPGVYNLNISSIYSPSTPASATITGFQTVLDQIGTSQYTSINPFSIQIGSTVYTDVEYNSGMPPAGTGPGEYNYGTAPGFHYTSYQGHPAQIAALGSTGDATSSLGNNVDATSSQGSVSTIYDLANWIASLPGVTEVKFTGLGSVTLDPSSGIQILSPAGQNMTSPVLNPAGLNALSTTGSDGAGNQIFTYTNVLFDPTNPSGNPSGTYTLSYDPSNPDYVTLTNGIGAFETIDIYSGLPQDPDPANLDPINSSRQAAFWTSGTEYGFNFGQLGVNLFVSMSASSSDLVSQLKDPAASLAYALGNSPTFSFIGPNTSDLALNIKTTGDPIRIPYVGDLSNAQSNIGNNPTNTFETLIFTPTDGVIGAPLSATISGAINGTLSSSSSNTISQNSITYHILGTGSATITVGDGGVSSVNFNPTQTTTSVSSAISNSISSSSSGGSGSPVTIVTNIAMSESLLDGQISKYTTAQDAHVSIDGTFFVRSSNSISDVVPGLTFQINASPTGGATKNATIKVVLGTDNTQSSVTGLMTAYNKLITDYNTMTANANNGKSSTNIEGTFGNDPTMLAFVEGIKRRFATGATYNIGKNDPIGNPYILSLSELGLDIQLDGTLSFNTTEYQSAIAAGLRNKLLQGARIGYNNNTDTLDAFITAQSGAVGAIALEIQAENASILALQKEQTSMQDRLSKIQDSYIAQYSGLNALLYQLNSTSANLASSLTALTNMAAGK